MPLRYTGTCKHCGSSVLLPSQTTTHVRCPHCNRLTDIEDASSSSATDQSCEPDGGGRESEKEQVRETTSGTAAEFEVAGWLESQGLGQYADSFQQNAINRETLETLDSNDLVELGVGPLGHRKQLLEAITKLEGPTDGMGPLQVDRATQLAVPMCEPTPPASAPGQSASPPPSPNTARIIKKGEFIGIGALVQLIGYICCLAAPGLYLQGLQQGMNEQQMMDRQAVMFYGILLGLIILVIGHKMAVKRICGKCGTRVEKTAMECPTCGATFF